MNLEVAGGDLKGGFRFKGVCGNVSCSGSQNHPDPFGGSKYDFDKKKHAECAFLELSYILKKYWRSRSAGRWVAILQI